MSFFPVAGNLGGRSNLAITVKRGSILHSLFDLNLSTLVTGSDQGPALRSICVKDGNQRLASL
jgi:hypothetical protein